MFIRVRLVEKSTSWMVRTGIKFCNHLFRVCLLLLLLFNMRKYWFHPTPSGTTSLLLIKGLWDEKQNGPQKVEESEKSNQWIMCNAHCMCPKLGDGSIVELIYFLPKPQRTFFFFVDRVEVTDGICGNIAILFDCHRSTRIETALHLVLPKVILKYQSPSYI